MKKLLAIFLCVISFHVQAQDYFSGNTLRFGGGYTRDFPGLSGYGLTAEYAHRMSDRLEAGLGIKRLNMTGHPRTSAVMEFTRATTLDFYLSFLPIASETSAIKIGLGYSFSFYKTRRSYPVIETHGSEKLTSWPVQDAKGRISGVILNGEYEYFISSNFSIGARASLCKAYDRVFYFGPFVGVQL